METVTKEWYIAYTREGAEQKVCEALRRKKLDSFYPTNKMTRLSYGIERSYNKPLISRYVFVCLSKEDFHLIKGADGFISLVHWMAKPVTVSTDDIFLLKRFFDMHNDISIEKIKVNPAEPASITGFLPGDNVNDICLSLPAIGYVMTARQRETRVKVITVSGYQTKTKLQNEYAAAR